MQAAAPGREVLEASVDQTGAFRFEDMAPDVYSLTLRPSPWGGGVEVFSFAAGQPRPPAKAAAAGGGVYFLWRSWLLYRAPSRAAAMQNFGASLIQLSLLVAGVVADAAAG